MIDPMKTDIDAVEELQLRRWARENYIPAEERDGLWHPVLLEELRRRDQELAEAYTLPSRAHAIVPLVPFDVLKLHQAHASPPSPNFLLSVAEIPVETQPR